MINVRVAFLMILNFFYLYYRVVTSDVFVLENTKQIFDLNFYDVVKISFTKSF